MYETYTTVIGTVISQPRRRQTAAGEDVFSFRMACNSRRLDKRNGEWVDGPTLYLTVSCWRKLIDGVVSVVAKGRPVIAHGQIKTNEYVADNGERRADLEMTATTVGLDLSRCEVTYVGATTRGGPGQSVTEPPEVVTQPVGYTDEAAA
ncbi:single-stranded DNA-binding protein [Williamsia soli]|uniref:single-stranded DNA-binding protein n=1 Tax=Williamsia soli TaxID=364929 RepID=UPI001A9CCB3C|nr:single-stranded DNA-binding protein [Williamsia soli]